jgi:exopolysaccharide production protein ExoY
MERFTGCTNDDIVVGNINIPPEQATAPAEFHPLLSNLATSVESPPIMFYGAASVDHPIARDGLGDPDIDYSLSACARFYDLSLAGLLFVLVLPLMAFCAIAVMLSSPGPVLFRQTRIGMNGREFTCLKFRTMADCAERTLDHLLSHSVRAQAEWQAEFKLQSDPRVTVIGKFLRRYSLDELPQLFNIFSGEMSVVGPRPIVHDEICRYDLHFIDYCKVKPGLTGLWQVSGRHTLSYDERVRLDAQYANSKSLRLDLLILWRTVPIVLRGQNE